MKVFISVDMEGTSGLERLEEIFRGLPGFDRFRRLMAAALERVAALGGSVIHPGEAWSVCRDSEGTPFGLAAGGP